MPEVPIFFIEYVLDAVDLILSECELLQELPDDCLLPACLVSLSHDLLADLALLPLQASQLLFGLSQLRVLSKLHLLLHHPEIFFGLRETLC